jgi:hypothetical protein
MKNKEQQTALQGFWDKIALKLSVEQINEFIPLLYQAKVVDWNQRVKDKIELSEFLANNNKQQTAVQTLINGLIDRKKNIIENADSMPNDMLEGGVMAFESAIDLAQSLLEMEKEQIEDAELRGKEIIIIKHTEHGGGEQ